MSKKIIPEVEMSEEPKRRAGFVPNDDWETDNDVRLWQVWMRSSDMEDERRATEDDLKRAGFVKRRGWGKKKR